MGRFGHIENLWAVLVGAVLVHGPFWYRPFLGSVPDPKSSKKYTEQIINDVYYYDSFPYKRNYHVHI